MLWYSANERMLQRLDNKGSTIPVMIMTVALWTMEQRQYGCVVTKKGLHPSTRSLSGVRTISRIRV